VSSVSVLVVSWNAGDALIRSLASLPSSVSDVVVVDNGSTDGSLVSVASRFPAVTLVRARMNLGFAGAVNAASRRASGEFLLLLGSHVSVAAGALDTLTSFLETHSDCGAVTGRLVSTVRVRGSASPDDESPEAGVRHVPQRSGWHVRRFPTIASLAIDLLLIDKIWPRNPVSRHYLALDVDYSRIAEIEQPATTCLLLRRSAFEAAGRMDEAFYPAWFEDVDLCRRMCRAGWRLFFHPGAVFVREGGGKRYVGHETFHRIWYRNLRRYARKHHGRIGAAVIGALVLLGMVLRVAVALSRGDRTAARTFCRVFVDEVHPHGYARLMDQLAGEGSESFEDAQTTRK
jgi:N-acetylglucosaminyl-diphospho-decaprenol L-rhamnosyltransferase